jgi:hypothetical protein
MKPTKIRRSTAKSAGNSNQFNWSKLPDRVLAAAGVPARKTVLSDLPSVVKMRAAVAAIDTQMDALRACMSMLDSHENDERFILIRQLKVLQREREQTSKRGVVAAFEEDGGNVMLHVYREMDLHRLFAKETVQAMRCIKEYCLERRLGRVCIISGIGPRKNPTLLPLVRKTVASDAQCEVHGFGPGHVVVEYD